MKKLLYLCALLVISKTAFSQKELVTLDEHNKYIFYQVMDMPGLSADTLYQRAIAGLKRKTDFKGIAGDATAVNVKTKTMLYSSQSYVKHEEGELSYTFHAEFKDFKYRFWLTDFVFKPYERNRYGVYERSHSIDEMALEQLKTKVDARIFENYLAQIGKYGTQIGEDLKKYTTTPVKTTKEPVKIDTRKW